MQPGPNQVPSRSPLPDREMSQARSLSSTKDPHNISMFHCNKSGQLVSSADSGRVSVGVHSSGIDDNPTVVRCQVPDIRGDVTMTSRRSQSVVAESPRLPLAECWEDAEERRGCGASARPDSPSQSSSSSVISSTVSAPVASTTLSASTVESAVAILSRVPPVGPASRAGWGLPHWARLRGGGESTGSTATATAGGWGAPPPPGSTPAPGTANWGPSATAAPPPPPPQNWPARPTGAPPQGPPPSGQPPQGPPPPVAAQTPPGNGPVPGTPGQKAAGTPGPDQNNPGNPPGTPGNNAPRPNPGDGGPPGTPGGANANNTPGASNNNNNAGGGAGGGGAGGPGGNGTAAPPVSAADSADMEKLKAMKAAIIATDGWGTQHVNQDTPWDIPPGQEPEKSDHTIAAWKMPGVNNGLEIWHNNLRNGGAPVAKPPEPQWQQHPHIPQTNHGGTWGEDDDASQGGNMWTGGRPPGPPGAPPGGPPGAHWGGGGPGGMWGGPGQKRDDWGAKPWEQAGRGPNADGWGQKPPGPYPPQHGPGGWSGDHSPPMGRRGAAMGFDDWGNKRGGGGWKEMSGGPVRPGMPGGPPAPHMMGRMPPGPGGPDGPHKDMDPWGRPPRNGWNEAPPGPGGGWGDDKWGGAAAGATGWGNKPKTPTMPTGMPGGWGAEPEMPDWKGGRPGPAGHGAGMHNQAAKNMFDKYRPLAEQGFKPEEVDLMLRSNSMTLEDAVDQLRLAGGGGGGGGGPGGGGDWRSPDHPPFDQHGFAQMPPPGHVQYPGGGGGMQMPNAGPGGGNMNPAMVQQLLRQQQAQQQQQQSSRFPGQSQAAAAAPSQTMAGLRPLVSQIQMAVHAGYLNPAILQSPMPPSTLNLLHSLLQQVKTMDQLTRQQQHLARSGQGGSHHLQQLQMEILRVKAQIQQSQAQIMSSSDIGAGAPGGGPGGLGASAGGAGDLLSRRLNQQPGPLGSQQQQQQLLLKQQLSGGGMQQGMYKQSPGGGASEMAALQAGMGDMSLRGADMGSVGGAAGGPTHGQSRLSQWKLPTDKPFRPDDDFSRAPGSGAKNTNSPPLSLMGDTTWSSNRPGGEGGWPDTNGAAQSATDGKDGWPSAAAVQMQNTYADLVPEFEPGKPWKMKSPEDDPGMTPGSARGLNPVGGAQDLLGMQPPGKASPTGNGAADAFGSSTWSFNPNGTKPGSMSANGKWDSGADWGLKSRGPPPGLNKSAGASSGWGRSAGGSQYDQRSAFAPVHGWGGGGSAWLLLRNLTAQIDGSTLKTLCMQHGPLYTFHMYLNQGVALVKYSSREEAAKAQGALNNCVLSNTTILAEAVSDEHADQLLQQLGLPGSQAGGGPYTQTPPANTGAPPAAPKPPASAAWGDMTDSIGSNMAWSSGGTSVSNSNLWATPSMDDAGRGPYLPDGLL